MQDSQNLIQKTANLFFPTNAQISSSDFDSLYTNLNLEDVLVKISDFIASNFYSEHITSTGFHFLLKVIFENNIFTYNSAFYVQKSGIAMGSKCGPSIANIYVHIIEKSFLSVHRPLFYTRFIDDIFTVVNNSFDLNILKKAFGYLTLNVITNSTVNFLDLNITLDKITGKLNFSLYIKPTNTFSYLLTNSNHPSFIFKNIPKSLFFRIRRSCTLFSDYLFFSRMLIAQLVERGYDFNIVLKCARMVGTLDRESLIPYKPKDDSFSKNTIFFKLPFNFNTLNLERAFSDSFSKISNSDFLLNQKLKLIFSMQPNLSSIFVHNFKLLPTNTFNFKICSRVSCKVCPYSDSNPFIQLNNFILPILSNTSCRSLNVVYVIFCRQCNFYYIGQTKRLSKRIREHVLNCFLNDALGGNCSSVFPHFNLPKHHLKTDFRFMVFRSNIDDLHTRLNIEAQLIYLFKILGLNILNNFIPDLYKYKTLHPLFV